MHTTTQHAYIIMRIETLREKVQSPPSLKNCNEVGRKNFLLEENHFFSTRQYQIINENEQYFHVQIRRFICKNLMEMKTIFAKK